MSYTSHPKNDIKPNIIKKQRKVSKKLKKARERYRYISEEERDKKWQFGRKKYKNLPEAEKKSEVSVEKI